MLSHIKIIDLSELVAGPYASMLLSDLGAEVIKVERVGKGDANRALGREFFNGVNRNKKSLCLDLKSKQGQEIFHRLSTISDIILEGFRPGVVKRLGVDYQTIKSMNSRIIYCSISGFGQDGPYRERPGHDINYMGVAGALSINGWLEPPPTLAISDVASSLFAVTSILAALIERERTGEGQYIDISMTDVLVSLVGAFCGEYYTNHPKMEFNFTLGGTYGVFKTKDGQYLTLGIEEDRFWERFCQVLEAEEDLRDPRFVSLSGRVTYRNDIIGRLSKVFARKTRKEWLDLLDKTGIPFGPLNAFSDVFSDPQVRSRSMVKKILDGQGKKIKQVAFPVKFSRTKPSMKLPPPLLGQQTEEILRGLGYSTRKMLELKAARVIEMSAGA